MTQWHGKARRKPTGGIRTAKRRKDKRLAEKGGNPTLTVLSDEERRSKVVGRGFTTKVKERRAKFASIADAKTKKVQKAEILNVEENNANRLFVRRNIITKGAVIKIKFAGSERLAEVTSKPGQQGQVQAVLLDRMPEVKQRKKAEKKEEKKTDKKEEKKEKPAKKEKSEKKEEKK